MSHANKLSIVTLAGILFVPLSHGQPGGATLGDIRGHQFEQLDADGDKHISTAEFRAWYLEKIDADFRRLDLDGDEQVSEDEFINRGKPPTSGERGRNAGSEKKPLE